MQVISIISTKGGVGKTTTAANLGGLVADAGLRVLLLDLDVQPTLSSYYELAHRAPGGIYELLAFNEQRLEQLVSRTAITGLDLVLSNDDRGELNTLLLHAPDGRLRLRHLLPTLAAQYDLVLIDTQGARSVLLEMAVLASDVALSPVTPEILAARELRRGTLQLIEDISPYRHLGIAPPPLHLLINRVHPVSSNAKLAELFITQDIRRKVGGQHEVVIVFDPKGDADLLKRMYVEAKRAGREGEFYVFHLGWPDISARYNAVGRFGRISEVATRIAGQLSGEGNSAAFREFAWRFVNIIARALVELGQRPDYLLIQRHVTNIDALFIEYAQHFFAKNEPKAWDIIVQLEARLNDKNIPRNMIGREKRVVALEQYLSQVRVYDPVLDGLRSAVRYDRTYFDKIVASLLPLLEKLTTGKIAQLLAPNYSDLADPRPIFDWMQIIRKRAVVYVGLDALSDAEVAAAVGNSMFSDLVSVAGHIYKFGIDDGLPGAAAGVKVPINVHADEFNELMGDEFIPMINKGGGAGVQVTAYTQTLSDIEARIGNRAKAGQVIGNFNNLFMLRVRETATAELLTRQLPKVEVYATTVMSGATDSSDPTGNTAFTSNTQDRITTTSVPLIEPSHVVALPKGQCFALIEGGNLWKIRMPLPAPDPDEAMPKDLQELAGYMRQHYVEAGDWWENQGLPSLQDTALPADLVDDFKQMAGDAAEAEA
ncbi:type IV conjugative transfer system coupling protein TraD [Achromobacter ruhlandii]|uniref:type IV conjugative transfer system coupling protein TraD n=1 Tax=Achromobacter ruhlandii TaxID=72557 RepID=UPI003BA32D38